MSGENIFNDGGIISSLGYNLSSDDGGGYLTGPGDQINTDPLLGPLQDNGGPTFTHALLPGSPAIDAGDPGFTPPPLNDQRGCHFDRVFNGRIDIGSFETQPPRRPCSTPRPRPTPLPRPLDFKSGGNASVNLDLTSRMTTEKIGSSPNTLRHPEFITEPAMEKNLTRLDRRSMQREMVGHRKK